MHIYSCSIIPLSSLPASILRPKSPEPDDKEAALVIHLATTLATYLNPLVSPPAIQAQVEAEVAAEGEGEVAPEVAMEVEAEVTSCIPKSRWRWREGGGRAWSQG